MKISLWLKMFLLSLFVGGYQSRSEEKRYYLPIPDKDIIEDKWFGDVYEKDGINDGMLKVGGWADKYYALIKMPVHLRVPDATRIIINRATMNLQSFGSLNPTPMKKGIVFQDWTETSTEDHWGLPYGVTGTIPAPDIKGGLYTFDISYECYYWLNGRFANYGLILVPEYNDNRFNFFRSSKNSKELRPNIEIFYEKVPDFKLPLPGGKAWKLTTETGGKSYDSKTEIDTAHTGHPFYSLDFSPRWTTVNGGVEQPIDPNTPILAAAGGIVSQVADTEFNPNGWYVKIDHDYDGNNNTGYQTVYLHFRDKSHLKVGNTVKQGDKLGIMGTTGRDDKGNSTSTAIHLHMTFYFQNRSGISEENGNSFQLDFLRMEGRALKDYKLNPTWNFSLGQWDPIYYESSNKP